MICRSGQQRYLTWEHKKQRTEEKTEILPPVCCCVPVLLSSGREIGIRFMGWAVFEGREIIGEKKIFLHRNFA